MQLINGFSKYSKFEKINWLNTHLDTIDIEDLKTYWHSDEIIQKKFDELSENTISNYFMPFGLAPNFLINNKYYCLPMVIEESSVVAAASLAAKFWSSRGGFQTKVLSTIKVGHVHLNWYGDHSKLESFFNKIKMHLEHQIAPLCANMNKRGGGVVSIELVDNSVKLPGHYKIEIKFETCDAMGANFINSVLEEVASEFQNQCLITNHFSSDIPEVVMSILSNYTPECLVEAKVECSINELGVIGQINPQEFAKKFKRAVDIAMYDTQRAVTHNKGIFNGIDSLVLATGNDFRAVEACGHTYAARSGEYKSLSSCEISDDKFILKLTLPLAIGTVGGLTTLHPLAKLSLKILGMPDAKLLMQQIACLGLAQNFAAIKSLVTTGIQKGHMKMHLLNILNSVNATNAEIESAKEFFKSNIVTYTAVRNFILTNRKLH